MVTPGDDDHIAIAKTIMAILYPHLSWALRGGGGFDLSSEATQGKASAVADKRLPNHWAKDFWLRV